jgi:O-antigen ligase
MLWSVVLAAMLVSARVIALSTGHSRAFWYVWSAIVTIIAFVSPISGIAVSVGNVFISLDDRSPLGLSVGQLAGAGAAARMFLQLATTRIALYQIWRPSLFALAGIVYVVLLSALVSSFPGIPYAALRKLVLIILLYLLTMAYADSFDRLLFLQMTVTLCAGFAAALTVSQALTGTELIEERAIGLTGNPNYQAIYLAVATPLVSSLAMYLQPIYWRILFLSGGGAIIGGVIVTASRGGLIALGISFVLVFMIWGRHGLRTRLLLSILLVALVIGLISSDYGDYALLRFDEAVSSLREGTASQTQSRVQLIQDSLEVWRRNPLLGVGAGNWLRGVSRLESRAAVGVTTPHVWPAQILAELGIIGVVCYIILFILCVRDYSNAIRLLDQQHSINVHLIRGFFGAALAMSLAWTSGNPYNQLLFEFLMIGSIAIRLASKQYKSSPR